MSTLQIWVMKPSARAFLVLLVLLAWGIRVGAVLALRDVHVMHAKSTAGADAIEFDTLARRLATGHGYSYRDAEPSAFRAPGFPLALALVYRINESYLAGYLFQCLMGALGVLFTYLIALEVMAAWLARLAGVICAVYYGHVYLSTVFLSETVFATALAAALWLFLVWMRTSNWPALIGSALLLGFAWLARPVAELIVPMLGMVLLVQRRYVAAVAFVVMAVAPVLPWLMRNHAIWGHYVMTNNGGSTFYGGNNDLVSSDPQLLGGWVATNLLPGRDKVDAAPNEYEHDQVEWQLGKQWVMQHPGKMPLLLVEKFVRFWAPDVSSPNRKFVILSVVTYTPILLLLVLALPTLMDKRNIWNARWLVVHSAVLSTMVVALLFWGSPRFRDANAPMLACYAAIGVNVIVQRKLRPSLT